MKDSFGKDWDIRCEYPIDKYCREHGLELNLEYKPIREGKCSIVYSFTKVYFKTTREVIIDRRDRYPISDDDLLLEIKKIIRERKINQIL